MRTSQAQLTMISLLIHCQRYRTHWRPNNGWQRLPSTEGGGSGKGSTARPSKAAGLPETPAPSCLPNQAVDSTKASLDARTAHARAVRAQAVGAIFPTVSGSVAANAAMARRPADVFAVAISAGGNLYAAGLAEML